MSNTAKKKDYFSNLFNKKEQKTNKQTQPFDENFFDLEVEGGPLHTSLITIKAYSRQGREELKIKCSWFLISPSNDIVQMSDVNGPTYQPCLEDVGSKLMIQAEPTMEGYEGMPKSVEVGPIELDENAAEDQQVPISQEEEEPQVELETDSLDFKNTLSKWKEKESASSAEKLVTPTKHSDTKLEGTPGLQKEEISTSSTVKSEDLEKKRLKDEKTAILVSENVKLKQDKDQLNQQIQKLNDIIRQNEEKIQETTEQLNTCTKNYYDLDLICKKHEQTIEQLTEMKVFLSSDVNIYKAQNAQLMEEISSTKEELSSFQKKMRRQTVNQDLQSLREQYSHLQKQLTEKDGEIEGLNNQIGDLNRKIEELESVIENHSNELKHERSKIQSLLQEKGLLQPYNLQKHHSMQSLDRSNNLDFADMEPEKEIGRLKQQISNLEATLRSLKFAYDQDVRFSVANKQLKKNAAKNQSQDWKFLQHLANTLSEIITEKETALENQTQINRELLKRLQQLQKHT